jgi:hypothetical protein
MSEYFLGVTFAEQAVTPSDDGVLRRAIFPDGILAGCSFGYSGSTLTMGAGSLLICGRQVRHILAQNWSVVDAASGYARLVLTVDLSKASTKDTFDQVNESIEYAASLNGFAELEQTDLNEAGTRYQVETCVVSLGSGGITGIVRTMPQAKVSNSGTGVSVISGNLAMEPQKYSITLSLEDGSTDTVILETDANDYPTKITHNGREIPWTVAGV